MTQVMPLSTKTLSGTRVVGGKRATSYIGKVRHFVFHPQEKRVVGFIVKRPDLLWMFRRKDLFVPLDELEMEDGRIRLEPGHGHTVGPAVGKQYGFDWDRCTIWQSMPIMTVGGEAFGVVSDVLFMPATGKVSSIKADRGALDKALMGQLEIPAPFIRGFKFGQGVRLAGGAAEAMNEAYPNEQMCGAIIVDDEVASMKVAGGLAEKAGKTAAVAQNRIHETTEQLKPHVTKAAKATEEATIKGAYVTGRQITRAKGMFGAFKEEYDKARRGDDE